MMATARAIRLRHLDRIIVLGVIAAAWTAAHLLHVNRTAAALHHLAMFDERATSTLTSFVLLLIAWQVMTAAMMLPSSLPLIHLFVRASASQNHPVQARTAFLAGSFAVWT